MAGIKTFSKNGQKAADILDRIMTPTDKAVNGGVNSVIDDIVKDTNIKNIGSFFASMVTGNKVTKATFDTLKSAVGNKKSNLFAQISSSTYASLQIEKDLHKHTKEINNTIRTLSKTVSDYIIALSEAPKDNKDNQTLQNILITLDTTNAKDLDKLLEVMKYFGDDDVKKIKNLVESMNSLSFVELKDLKTNIVEPLNSLKDLDYKNIIEVIDNINKSSVFDQIPTLFVGINDVTIDKERIGELFSTLEFASQALNNVNTFLDENTLKELPNKFNLFGNVLISSDNLQLLNTLFTSLNDLETPKTDTNKVFEFLNNFIEKFSNSLSNINSLDNELLNILPKKLELIIALIGSSDEEGLRKIIEVSNSIKPIDSTVVSSITDLTKIAALLALIPEVIDSENLENILKSLDNLKLVLDKLIKFNYEKTDFEEISNAMDALEKVGKKMKDSTMSFSNAVTDISAVMPTTQQNLDSILNAYEVTAEKTEEVDALTQESMGSKTFVNIENLGRAVLEISAVMLIGTYLLTKNPEMLKTAIKFALTLAAFTAIVVTPLILLSSLTTLLKSSGESVEYFSTAIIKLSFCLMIGVLFYSLMGIKASMYSKMFTKDLMVFVLGISLVIPLFGLFARKGTGEAIEALAQLVVKLSVTMIIGALFMMIGGGRLAKAAIEFAVMISLFLFLITIPVKMLLKGGLFSNSGKGDALEALGHFVTSSATIMMIGALFMLYKNGKLAKYAIGFGLVFTAFLFAIVSPIKWLLKGGLFANFGKGEVLNNFTTFVAVSATILMIGGLFMLLKGGRMGLYALQFALLLSGFVFSLVLSLKLITEHMTIKKWLAIRTFKKMIEEFALLLIVGGTLMLIPGFAKNILLFASITTGFVLIMAVVIKMLANTMTVRSQRGMMRFAWSILIITGSLLLAVAIAKRVSWKELAMAGALILGVAIIIAGFALLLGSRFISSKLTTASLNLIKMAVAIGILGITLALMTRIVKSTDWADVGKVAVLLLMVVGLFALMAIPYVAAVIGIGSTMFILMGTGLLLLAAGMVVMHKIVHRENVDYVKDAVILGDILSGIIDAFRGFVSWENLGILLGATVAAILFSLAITLLTVPLFLLHLALMLDLTKDAIKLKITLSKFLESLDIITTKDAFKTLGLGVAASILVCLIDVLLTAALISLKIALLLNPQKDILKLKATLATFLDAMTVIGTKDALITLGLATVASLLILLIGVFLFGGIVLIRLITIANPKKDVEKLVETLVCFMTALDVITTKEAFATLGVGVAAAALIMVTGVLLFTGFLLIRLVVIANPKGDIDKLKVTLEGFVEALDVITTKQAFKNLGLGIAASAMLMVIGILLAAGLGALRLVLIGDPISDTNNLKEVMNDLADMLQVIQDRFGIVGGTSLGKAFGLGKNKVNLPELILKAGMLSAVLLAIGLPLRIIVKTANFIKANNVDASSIGTFLLSFTGTITELFEDDSIDWSKIAIKSIFISFTIGRIASAISKMAETVQDIANLKIATEWNDKGKPIRYRELKTKDFQNMVTNVKLMFDSMLKPFLDICNDPVYKPLIDEFGAGDNLFGKIFGSKSTVGAAISLSFKISKVIGSLAEGVSGIANLMIPIDWNENGVATKYRVMKDDDYTNAASGIKKILNTMIDAIGEFANGEYSDLIEEFAKSDTGFLAIFKSKSKIGAALEISFKMSELVASMADSISKYADLKFPTHFDNTGKADKFITIGDEQFGVVTENIGKVLKLMIGSVVDAMDSPIMNGITIISFWEGKGKRYQKGFENIKQGMSLVGEAAKQLNEIANMNVPIYKNGREVGKQPFSETDAQRAMDVVKIILPAIPTAIAEAMTNMPAGDITDLVTTKLMPSVELMNNVIDVIQKYANLTFPYKWKDGKVIEYKQFDPDAEKTKMTGVFKTILCGMVEAVRDAYEGTEGKPGLKQLLEDTDISQILNSLKPITDLFNSIIKTIQAYVDFKAPIYDKEGKVSGYKTFLSNGSDLSAMLDNVEDNLSKMVKGLINSALSVKAIITPEVAMELDDTFDSVAGISDKITKMVKCISDIYNLKVPKPGGFDKDGKPKNGYMNIIELVNDNGSTLQTSLTSLFALVPNAIIGANTSLVPKKEQLDSAIEYVTTILESCTTVIGHMTTIMDNIQNFKIPTKFDKDGNAIAYISLAENKFDEISKKINNLFISIPNALIDSYEMIKVKSGKDDVEEYINSVCLVLTGMTQDVMKQIPAVIDTYLSVKEAIASIQPKEIETNVGGFMKALANSLIEISKINIDENTVNVISSSIATMFGMINTISLEIANDSNENLSTSSLNKFNILAKSFVEYQKNFEKIVETFDYILSNLQKYDITTLANIESTVTYCVGTILRISAMLENPTSIEEKENTGIFGGISAFIKNQTNPNIIKTITDFALVANDLDTALTALLNSVEKVNTIGNPSLEPIENLLDVVCEHTDKLKRKSVDNFKKEAESLDKFTKAIDRVNVSKVNGLTKLFDSMEGWSSSVGDLKEFTKALSEELAGTLMKLTNEINEAKGVIKKADEQRVKRQKQLNDSIEKIEKLMDKTLHVNVSSENGKTISSAWENPD